MKIAFIVDSFPKLSETFILNQITDLLDLGHDVEIFASPHSNEKEAHPDVEKYQLMEQVHYFNIPKSRVKRIFKAIYLILVNFYKHPVKILKALNIFKYKKEALSLRLLYIVVPFLVKDFNIVHCHFGPNGVLGVLLRDIGAVNGKVVTTFHGYDMSGYIVKKGTNIYNFLFEKGDVFLPISEYWKKKLIELGCEEDKIIVHRMGIDLDKFSLKLSKENKSGIVKLITVARLVKKKGIEYGVRAVAKIIKKYPNIKYSIVGDGPLRNMLEDLIIELGAKGKINLLGPKKQDEIIKLMQNSDILLAPSVTTEEGDQEGIPVVLMEAQATGLPVISTYHTGIPEVVLDGKSGFLVPERDVDALAEKLEYLIEHPEIWPDMGKAGRKFIEERYDINKLNKRLVEIYCALLTNNV